MRCDQNKKKNSISSISSPVNNEKLLMTTDIWWLRLQLFHLGLNSTFHYSFPRFGLLQSPFMSMREKLCRANLPPEAIRENPLS
jgi:hypothetical protein